MPPNSKETELESSNKEASPSAGKNIKIVLVPCCSWKCVLATTSGGVNICKVLWHCLLQQMNSRWKSRKLLQGLVSYKLTAYLFVSNLFLTQWIMTILSKGCKPDTFESYNSLKLSFTNIWGLPFNFTECENFLESNSPDISALCVTNLYD